VIEIAQTTRLDVALQVGTVSEEIQVVGEAPLVRSTTAELGQVIQMKQIQAMPLNGRFFQHLITMTPGAMPFYSRGDEAENPSAGGARIATAHSVNGMPWSGNNYLLDGVVNNEPLNAYINITPPLEAIQAFKVQTNLRRELDLRAAPRTGAPRRAEQLRRGEGAGRGMGRQRHHQLPQRRSARHP